jgi:hypothetical protein
LNPDAQAAHARVLPAPEERFVPDVRVGFQGEFGEVRTEVRPERLPCPEDLIGSEKRRSAAPNVKGVDANIPTRGPERLFSERFVPAFEKAALVGNTIEVAIRTLHPAEWKMDVKARAYDRIHT